jgi:hypothetical protein
MFRKELDEATEEHDRREAEEKAEHQKELNEHKAAYLARLDELKKEYGFLQEQPQTTQQARKNILLWLKYHFPGVNFKISVNQHTRYYEQCNFGLSIQAPENTPEEIREQFKKVWAATWGETLPTGEEGNVDYDEYDGPNYSVFEEYRKKPMWNLFKSYDFWGVKYNLPAQDFENLNKKTEPAELPKEHNATVNASCSLIEYSEKAIAVVGNTKAIKEQLKAIGGRFNARLTCGAGWIFSKKKENELKQLLSI